MEHKMVLFSADLKTVYARLAKKFNAGVAQVAEHLIRNEKGEVSSASTGSSMFEVSDEST